MKVIKKMLKNCRINDKEKLKNLCKNLFLIIENLNFLKF